MEIVITPSEANARGIWEELCDLKGLNVWAVKEGLMESEERLILTEEEALKLRLM